MTKYYKFDRKLKKRMLSKWLNSQKKHKVNRIIGYALYAVAAAICVGCYVFVTSRATDIGQPRALSFGMIGFFVGVIFGSIPFAIGQAVINKSKKEYGRPYCRMTREFLYVDDKGIQFGYHNTENKYTASMDVYQILYEDINRVTYDETYNIVTIMGCGQLIAYDDYSSHRINKALSERKFYADSCYSFILAFEEQTEFLNLISIISSNKNWEGQ